MCKSGHLVQALLDVVRDNLTKTPCLIFEYVDNTDWKTLYPKPGSPACLKMSADVAPAAALLQGF